MKIADLLQDVTGDPMDTICLQVSLSGQTPNSRASNLATFSPPNNTGPPGAPCLPAHE